MRLKAFAMGAAAALVMGAAVGAADTQPLNLNSVTGTVPAAWKAGAATQFRLAQFQLPAAAGDTLPAQFIVFHFGKGGGGTVEDNVKRWRGMVRAAEGAKEAKTETQAREGLKITSLKLDGTYMERPFPASQQVTERPNFTMLAAIVETTKETGDGPYYLRIVGPTKSVEAARPGWEALLNSLKTK